MRNLVEYPIDREEVIQTLTDCQRRYEGLIGGTQSLILDSILAALATDAEVMDKIVKLANPHLR
jgi:hypothetical protein